MKLRLRCHETRETLKFELADTATLFDLQRRVNPQMAFHVHLSLNRKDKLVAPSPMVDTLQSLGVTSGDLIYYSLKPSAFVTLVKRGESSNSKLGYYETLASQWESNQAIDQDSMDIGFVEVNVSPLRAKTNLNSDVEDRSRGFTRDNSGMKGPEFMDVEQKFPAGKCKRLSEPLFLKKILLENSGDISDLTTLGLSIHAIMLESGLMLLDFSSDKFSFSEKLLSVSLKYTLPELIKVSRKETKKVDYVTVTFRNLARVVIVYGNMDGSSGRVRKTNLDKRRFLPVIDTLKSEKQVSSSSYRDVLMLWRMVKDELVIPLLSDLCDKAGLESPPCLIRLPTELKQKILESLCGVSIGKMACVCKGMRNLTSDNDLWKQKCVEEGLVCYRILTGKVVNWKNTFAEFWRNKRRSVPIERRKVPIGNARSSLIIFRDPRERYPWFGGDRLMDGSDRRSYQGLHTYGTEVHVDANLDDETSKHGE